MSEKIKIKGETSSGAGIDGELDAKWAAEDAEDNAKKSIQEAKAILARYRPNEGRGASLNEPSQGEAQRMLDCIQGLYAMIQAPSARVQHQEVKLETR